MLEKVVISFEGDPGSIQKVIDSLKGIGKVSDENARKFEEANKKHKVGLKETGGEVDRLEGKFKNLSERLAAIFAIEKIKEFTKEAVKSFLESEEQMKRMKFAVTKANGESELSFKSLQNSSESLSKSLNNLFTKDQINAAKTQLANFGLSAEKIDQLIPRITDLAAATGKDLNEVTQKSILALDGQTRGLRELGINFKDTGDKEKNFNLLLQDTKKFAGAAAEGLDDDAAKAQEFQNNIEDLKSSIGKFIVNEGHDLSQFFRVILGDSITYSTEVISLFKEQFDKGFSEINLKLYESIKNTPIGFQREQLALAIKKYHDQATQLTKDYDDQKISAEEYIGAIKSINSAISELQDASEKAGKQPILGKTEKDVSKEKDLFDEILAIQRQRESESISQTKATLKFQADEQKKYAELTISDEQELANTKIAINQQFFNDIAAIDRKALQDQANRDIKRIEHITASEKQKSELIEQINLKLIEELSAIDENAERQKLSDSEKEFEALSAQLDKQNNDIAKKQEDNNKKSIQLELQRQKDQDSLRLLQAKDAEEKREAKIINIKNQEQRDLEDLENERNTNSLLTQEEYETKKQLIIAKANSDIDALNKEFVEKEKKIIQEFFDLFQKISDSLEQTIQQNIQSINALESRQESRIETQRVLAAQGLQNDLAFEERRADMLEEKRLQEERKAKRAGELKVFLTSVEKFAEDNPNTAVQKALGILAATKAAEVLFGEEGGIIGDSKMKRYRWNASNIPSHRSGRDVLLHAEIGEQLLSVEDTKKFQQLGGLSLLKKPLTEMPIPKSAITQHGVDFSGLEKRLEGIESIISKRPYMDSVKFMEEINAFVVSTVKGEIKETVTILNNKSRL